MAFPSILSILSLPLLLSLLRLSSGYVVLSLDYSTFGNSFDPWNPQSEWQFLQSPDGDYESNRGDFGNVGANAFIRSIGDGIGYPAPGPYAYFGMFRAFVELRNGPIHVPIGSVIKADVVFQPSVVYDASSLGPFMVPVGSNNDPRFSSCGIWFVDTEHNVTVRYVTTGYSNWVVHERLGYPGFGAPDSGVPSENQGYSSWAQVALPANWTTPHKITLAYYRGAAENGIVNVYVDDVLAIEFGEPGSFPPPIPYLMQQFTSQPIANTKPVDMSSLQIYLGCGTDWDKLNPLMGYSAIAQDIGPVRLTTANSYHIPTEFMDSAYNGTTPFRYDATLLFNSIDVEIEKVFCDFYNDEFII